ncbi:MAG TPA: PepSY-associated TM helix domain-containing protein, partial [Candidatus Binatia bacterium]|nr:PepSY-associated TM helix domain-containing protein [Candidatus Binatia bacterium]
MKKLIFNLHLYMALAAGAFVLLLGLTGRIMAFEPELDHLLHRKLSYVTPAAHALSLVQIKEIVARAYPGDRIQNYELSTAPEISYQVSLEKTGDVYLNQYTGEILGVRSKEEFLDYVHQLHIRLLWRGKNDPGKTIITWSGVAALFLACSGLYLWWPLKRTWVARGTTGRRVWFDLHSVTGIFSFLFLLLLTLTGVMLGFERSTNQLLYRITGTQPSPMPRSVPAPPEGATPLSPDQAIEIARGAV